MEWLRKCGRESIQPRVFGVKAKFPRSGLVLKSRWSPTNCKNQYLPCCSAPNYCAVPHLVYQWFDIEALPDYRVRSQYSTQHLGVVEYDLNILSKVRVLRLRFFQYPDTGNALPTTFRGISVPCRDRLSISLVRVSVTSSGIGLCATSLHTRTCVRKIPRVFCADL